MSLSFNKINLLIEQLDTVIEERARLHQLNLSPSKIDNNDLINICYKIIKSLNYWDEDFRKSISNRKIQPNVRAKYDADFNNIIDKYNQLLSKLDDDLMINSDEYIYRREPILDISTIKTVRFKDNLIEDEPQTFKPYTDEIQESWDVNISIQPKSSHSSLNDYSNQQIFVQHQQSLLEQDDHLSLLSQSIQRQRELGLNINEEVDDQLIILNDLENLIDRSESRLDKAKRRLNHFNKLAKENAQWVTIFILVFILILLLVVLN